MNGTNGSGLTDLVGTNLAQTASLVVVSVAPIETILKCSVLATLLIWNLLKIWTLLKRK